MEDERARALLRGERSRVEALLTGTTVSGRTDRAEANQPGDLEDRAESLTNEEVDDAVAAQLRDRLAAIDRAERRLEQGTFGRSLRSGLAIPDDRLEADPTAELTVDEAQQPTSD